jgi:hypothetical protein
MNIQMCIQIKVFNEGVLILFVIIQEKSVSRYCTAAGIKEYQ